MYSSQSTVRMRALVATFADHAKALEETQTYYRDSDADTDCELAQTWVVPVFVITGLATSVSDHLEAWTTKSHDGHTGLFSDFTLFRPVIESLAAIIWILGAPESKERVSRTIQFVNIELRKGQHFVADLAKAGAPDRAMQDTFVELENALLTACESAQLESAKCMPRRPLDPSAITKKAAPYVPGPTLDTYKYWALCSAHAHSQLFTMLTKSNAHRGIKEREIYDHADGNLYNLFELFDFVVKLITTATAILAKRGFTSIVPAAVS